MGMGCQQDTGSVEHGWIETFLFACLLIEVRKLPCWGLPVGYFRLLIKRFIGHLLVQRWVRLGICNLRGFRVCKRHGHIVFYMAKDVRKRQDPMAGWLWTFSKQSEGWVIGQVNLRLVSTRIENQRGPLRVPGMRTTVLDEKREVFILQLTHV